MKLTFRRTRRTRNPSAYFPGYPAPVRLNYISAQRLVRLIIRKGI